MLIHAVQSGSASSRFYPGPANLLDPIILLVVVVCLGTLAVLSLELVLTRSRHAVRSRRSGRRRDRAAATAETRARALMSELCPHGWSAQITLFGEVADHVPVAPDGRPSRVALDWAELEPGSGRPLVTRRVWAPTIAEALDAMVADRRTDETLEQIERGAVAHGEVWPDV
jgi:hypothetical protein